MKYNSEAETRKHIAKVGEYLLGVIQRLTFRITIHDDSKLSEMEKPIFDAMTPKLAKCTYGSKQYKKYLEKMKPALDNHYNTHRHHPEHFMKEDRYILNLTSAVGCMNLIDVIEMLCDWKAATLRHNNGDIYKSIDLNQKRFGYTNELREILINTAKYLDF